MSLLALNNLLFQLCESNLDEKLRQLRYIFRDHLPGEARETIQSVADLFEKLRELGVLDIDDLSPLREAFVLVERHDLVVKVQQFEAQRREGLRDGILQRHVINRGVVSLQRAAGRLSGAVSMKTAFKLAAGGVVFVAVYKILGRCSSIEEFCNVFNSCVLPAGTKLMELGEGSVHFIVRADDLTALKALWNRYQEGKLRENLQTFLVTEGIKQLELEVTVTIDEDEYNDACLDFMKTRVYEIQEGEQQMGWKRQWCSESDVSDNEAKAEQRSLLLRSTQPLVEELEETKMFAQVPKDEARFKDLSDETLEEVSRLEVDEGAWETFLRVSGQIQRPVMCAREDHEKEPLKFFCEECNVCICHKCKIEGHNEHCVWDIQEAAEERKAKMTQVLGKVEDCVAACQTEEREGTELLDKCEEEINSARNKLVTVADGLIQRLEQHKSAGTMKLDAIWVRQKIAHEARQKEYESFVTQLMDSLQYGKAILEREVGLEILQEYDAVKKRCEDLLNAEKIEFHKPPLVSYIAHEEAIETAEQLVPGRIVFSGTDPSQSTAEGKGLKDAEVGREAMFTVVTKNSDGKQPYHQDDLVAVKIQTPAGEDLEKKIKDSKDGTYTVTYIPSCVGQHDVLIVINGEPLACSPWSVHVSPHLYQEVFKFGSSGKGGGQFNGPSDIAVSIKTGNIAIADHTNKRVQVFSPDGKYLREMGRAGPKTEQLDAPNSVAFTRSDDIIVPVAEKMFLFSAKGAFIKHISNEHLKDPYSVSVGKDGHMLICDWGDKAIKVLSPEGTELLQSFTDPDYDNCPWFAVFHQEKFFASYFNGPCVKVFDNKRLFSHEIGSMGSGPGQLNRPAGLAVDKFDNLIVCDSHNERLQVFTPGGEVINEIRGSLDSPRSVAVSEDGKLFVIDDKQDCVYVFD